ncbi:MAG: hypothetical protein OEZ32_09790 [Nitrospinota bacterium]|nr:hypothetical protein [Nitrospinota bacterium]
MGSSKSKRSWKLAPVFAMALLIGGGGSAGAETGGVSLDEALSGFDDSGNEEQSADTGLDDALSGFDDAPKEQAPAQSEPMQRDKTAAPWLDLTGATTVSSSYNYAQKAPLPGKTDYRGMSRLRGRLDLKLDADLPLGWKARVGASGYHDLAYSINGRDNYTEETLEEYESEVRLKEAYITGSPIRSVDIKIGRQIAAWGRSDNIRVTDVLNPMDIREPGMVDIEDIREPVTMSRIDFYFGDWSLTGIAIHEIKFNFMPAYGSDFYPLDTPMPPEEIPSSSAESTEYGMALSGIFPGFDISIYLADFYDDNFSLKSAPMIMTVPTIHPPPAGAVPFTLVHNRLKMVGLSMNKALGNFMAKMEAAWLDGYKFAPTGDEIFQRYDGLLGIEYTGFTETMFSFEIAARHIPDHVSAIADAPLGVNQTEWQMALRYTQDFMHQTVHLLALVSVMGLDGAGGAFERLQLKYDIIDSMSATIGVVAFQSGDTPFLMTAEDNDRAFLEIKYSF